MGIGLTIFGIALFTTSVDMIMAAYLHQKTYLLIWSFDLQLTAYLRESTQLIINIISNYVYICVPML